MLVISRRPTERIVLSGGIEIVVVECRSGRTRIGINAPAGVKVLRGELEERYRPIGRPPPPKIERVA